MDVFHFSGHQEELAAGIKISFLLLNSPEEISIVEPSKLIEYGKRNSLKLVLKYQWF